MRELSARLGAEGTTLGFVPTMGALHEGHLSLLRLARSQSDISVMSVYVNPTQFGPAEDLETYPRRFEEDCRKAEAEGCDIVFHPSDSEVYPSGFSTYVAVEGATETLCGAVRPGHFRGVTTIVLKLFNIVRPTYAVFGQKDAQQVIVIKRMVADLNVPVRIVVAPTVREPDGLAMSSRNAYLTEEERRDAPRIHQGLKRAEELFRAGGRDPRRLLESARDIVEQGSTLTVDYMELVDTVRLRPVREIEGPVLLATRCSTRHTDTHLIDNTVLGGSL